MLELISDLQRRVGKCTDCRGTGYRLDGRSRVMNCTCLNESLYELRLAKSGIPPRFKHLEFKDYMYKNSSTFGKIWKYIEHAEKASSSGTGLVLYGKEATGKSMLACCILKELMKRGYDCGFTRFSGVIGNDVEKETYLGKSKTFAVIDDITEVLDNLVNFKETTLTHQQTNGAVSFLGSILSTRAMKNQPTILTATVPINQISQKFASLGSMLLGNFLQIECVEGDFRGTRVQERLQAEFGFDECE